MLVLNGKGFNMMAEHANLQLKSDKTQPYNPPGSSGQATLKFKRTCELKRRNLGMTLEKIY